MVCKECWYVERPYDQRATNASWETTATHIAVITGTIREIPSFEPSRSHSRWLSWKRCRQQIAVRLPRKWQNVHVCVYARKCVANWQLCSSFVWSGRCVEFCILNTLCDWRSTGLVRGAAQAYYRLASFSLLFRICSFLAPHSFSPHNEIYHIPRIHAIEIQQMAHD